MDMLSLVFLWFAVRKRQYKYIPAAVAMIVWFLLSALTSRPPELLLPSMGMIGVMEKIVFAVMAVLLILLCVIEKNPLRLDWFPLAGSLLAAVVRIGWYVYFHFFLANVGENPFESFSGLRVISGWKDILLHLLLGFVAVWHIYRMCRPRTIR